MINGTMVILIAIVYWSIAGIILSIIIYDEQEEVTLGEIALMFMMGGIGLPLLTFLKLSQIKIKKKRKKTTRKEVKA